MERLPKILVENVQLTASNAAYGSPVAGNAYQTINSAVAVNTTATPRTLDVYLVPAAGSATDSNRVVAALVIPAAGAFPTILSALIGQHLMQGGQIYAKADAAAAVTIRISGYETTR